MTDEKILLAHGGGGELTGSLIREIILDELGESATGGTDDAAVLETGGRTAFTTDSYVVKPLFFPGGDLGRLAVCGTVNDLAMRGARPIALSLALIIEEGFEIATLKKILASVAATAKEAGVRIVTGDTKVVERYAADGLYINTAGVGIVADGVEVSLSGAREGDEVVVSGPVGNHAIAVLAQREGLAFETVVESDAAPLALATQALLRELGSDVHVLNDPTRGGLAASLNTIAEASGVAIEIEESAVPADAAVVFAAEMLGLDILTLANEGKLVAVVAQGRGADAVRVLGGKRARGAVIGGVSAGGGVILRAGTGTGRVLEMPYGEEAPRIC